MSEVREYKSLPGPKSFNTFQLCFLAHTQSRKGGTGRLDDVGWTSKRSGNKQGRARLYQTMCVLKASAVSNSVYRYGSFGGTLGTHTHTHKKGIHMDTQVAMIVGLGSYHSSKGRCCYCKLQDSSRFNLRKSSHLLSQFNKPDLYRNPIRNPINKINHVPSPFQNEEIIICPLVSLGYNL